MGEGEGAAGAPCAWEVCLAVGWTVGEVVGSAVGANVGAGDGADVGAGDGADVGTGDGADVGTGDGADVGALWQNVVPAALLTLGVMHTLVAWISLPFSVPVTVT